MRWNLNLFEFRNTHRSSLCTQTKGNPVVKQQSTHSAQRSQAGAHRAGSAGRRGRAGQGPDRRSPPRSDTMPLIDASPLSHGPRPAGPGGVTAGPRTGPPCGRPSARQRAGGGLGEARPAGGERRGEEGKGGAGEAAGERPGQARPRTHLAQRGRTARSHGNAAPAPAHARPPQPPRAHARRSGPGARPWRSRCARSACAAAAARASSGWPPGACAGSCGRAAGCCRCGPGPGRGAAAGGPPVAQPPRGQLPLAGSRLCLYEDGTELSESYFRALPPDTELVLLGPGETWRGCECAGAAGKGPWGAPSEGLGWVGLRGLRSTGN